jgi:FKBP-type peptidyl-prolyl cis-trans isomerase FkpA
MQMKSGEEANVYCPASTAYGNRASGQIPAGSDLLFEISVK